MKNEGKKKHIINEAYKIPKRFLRDTEKRARTHRNKITELKAFFYRRHESNLYKKKYIFFSTEFNNFVLVARNINFKNVFSVFFSLLWIDRGKRKTNESGKRMKNIEQIIKS